MFCRLMVPWFPSNSSNLQITPLSHQSRVSSPWLFLLFLVIKICLLNFDLLIHYGWLSQVFSVFIISLIIVILLGSQVNSAFNGKRKMIRNTLQHIATSSEVEEALKTVGLPATVSNETLLLRNTC